MKVRIEIDTRTFVRFWLVVIGFAIALLAIYSARQALIVIGIAFFLALALNTPVNYLAKHSPGKSRVGATALAYIVVVALLGAFVVLVVPPIAQQTVKFIETVPSIVNHSSAQWSGVGDIITKYHIQPQVDSAVNSLKDNTAHWAANAGKNVLSGVGSLVGFLTSLLLVLVLSFLMLVEGPVWMRHIWGLYNDEDRMQRHRQLATRMHEVVSGYVTGQLTVSAIGALMAGITVFVISLFTSVPSNLTLPTVAIAFTLSLIPMFGATISGIIISLLILMSSVTGMIVFIAFFIIYQQIENNFVSPAIQSRRVELSALAVLGSVTIGLYVFGLLGGIISIPIAGSLKVLLDDYLQRLKRHRIKEEKPIAKLIKKIHGNEA